ncbi:MAG: hypothetical protein IT561_24280 [Alphaproteobacteria bacterium]|nr:hypothetical protein [Alphaproteobacteria bacterium]
MTAEILPFPVADRDTWRARFLALRDGHELPVVIEGIKATAFIRHGRFYSQISPDMEADLVAGDRAAGRGDEYLTFENVDGLYVRRRFGVQWFGPESLFLIGWPSLPRRTIILSDDIVAQPMTLGIVPHSVILPFRKRRRRRAGTAAQHSASAL